MKIERARLRDTPARPSLRVRRPLCTAADVTLVLAVHPEDDIHDPQMRERLLNGGELTYLDVPV